MIRAAARESRERLGVDKLDLLYAHAYLESWSAVPFDHPGTAQRRPALDIVAKETGATVNQVVLAWLMGGDIPVIPLVGASSGAQLTEGLDAVEWR